MTTPELVKISTDIALSVCALEWAAKALLEKWREKPTRLVVSSKESNAKLIVDTWGTNVALEVNPCFKDDSWILVGTLGGIYSSM